MRIDAAREGGAAVLRLAGRLDREWAEHLSGTMEDLLRTGVRSVSLDLSDVTYVSSAATAVFGRWRRELAVLRGDIRVTSLSPAVRDTLAIAGWDSQAEIGRRSGPISRPESTWQLRATFAAAGDYQTSTSNAEGRLVCRLHGRPRLGDEPVGPEVCAAVGLPRNGFGLGVGAIGWNYEECQDRFGELTAIAGCVAHFPSDGARMPDYLVADGGLARAVLASGLTCEGDFAKLVRFSPRGDAGAIPLSELAGVCLEAVGQDTAGVVIAAETAGLCGARMLRSPAAIDAPPFRFEVPAIRDWLSFAPERNAQAYHRAHRRRGVAHVGGAAGGASSAARDHRAAVRPFPRRRVRLPSAAPTHRRARRTAAGTCSPTTRSATSFTWCGTIGQDGVGESALCTRRRLGRTHHPVRLTAP